MKNKKIRKINREYGHIFAEIRKEKGYSQHEIEDSNVSAASISRFERGETMIGTDSFMEILENIGVSAAEFEYISYQLSNSLDLFPSYWALTKAANSNNLPLMEILLDKIERRIQLQPNIKRFRLDKILAETVIFHLDATRKVPSEEVKFLTHFLKNTKYWGHYEVTLISWTTEILEKETLNLLLNQMFTKNKSKLYSFNDNKLFIDTSLNILDTFLTRKDLVSAKDALFELENYDIHPQLLFEKMELKYDKARFNFLSDFEAEFALKEMWYYYDVLKYTENYELANIVRNEIGCLIKDKDKNRA
ncbi:MAG: helix-turn-helix domain-containing protein [Streptococcaceae bacterium]|jgi:Rgg/GadR/MutR family transcriptional activator|nr:helix-turn-helix domain-containing protein [Streptococcaceae bacterium]